ncbi:hypothetical protein BJ170DRAFT_70620 [Xylariales sp. AK1849]|nr:hypothetical protein BJ170DRAFT_70620 [Xylariales sp. AK1849]
MGPVSSLHLHATTVERVLVATAAFSLTVSVLIEISLFYLVRKGAHRTKSWLRRILLSVLLLNSLFSLSSLVFVTFDQATRKQCPHASTRGGRRFLEQAAWSGNVDYKTTTQGVVVSIRQSDSLVPLQLSCLLMFAFSLILLVSAWIDLRDDKQEKDCIDEFGEKGEIHL